ncbi:unnamed protein product [Didymodactylos carnosus]|uniref:Uncharacterized protein n=1 Tax=Didymodactylos carnosus TaxID=1234261 RepID=A0A814U1B1_9BILA|nr:unnamed protein product [Didymodactylos carnosus]CAF3933831.1 unnamed protein product [Didymodactylos carnosus]
MFIVVDPNVVYVNRNDTQDFIFVYADEILVHVEQSGDVATFSGILCLLLSFYYTFDLQYPKHLRSFMELIDFYIQRQENFNKLSITTQNAVLKLPTRQQ